MLVGLVESAARIVEIGCPRLFDVSAEDMGHGMSGGEVRESASACRKHRKVGSSNTPQTSRKGPGAGSIFPCTRMAMAQPR